MASNACDVVVLGGGNAAGYVAKAAVEAGIAPRVTIVGEEAVRMRSMRLASSPAGPGSTCGMALVLGTSGPQPNPVPRGTMAADARAPPSD